VDYRLLLFLAIIFAVLTLGAARTFFRDERGMSASQMLFAALMWFILMIVAIFWMRYGFRLPF
jgi:hypothetical protein